MKSAFTAIVLLLVLTAPARSQEWRRIEPIAAPAAPVISGDDGGRILAEQIPLERRAVEQAMQTVAQSWNSPDMAGILSESFQNKDRLMDVIDANAPMDATLRLVSVGGYRILNQVIQQESSGNVLVSRVSVTARVQVEYNDPVSGFQRRPGEQEYILKITQRLGDP